MSHSQDRLCCCSTSGRVGRVLAIHPSSEFSARLHAWLVALLVLGFFPGFAWAQMDGRPAGQLRGKALVDQVGLDQHLERQIPLDATFRDESGATVSLEKYVRDRPVILTLVYYRCPMLCNQVLNGLLESTQGIGLTMGRDYHVVSISIDPRETPEIAAAKKERYVSSYHRPGAEEGWHFLTGDQENIDRITETVGFRYVYDAASDQYAHASGIVVLTPQGRISRYFYGIDYYPTHLRLGLVESSENRIGTPVDQLLLLCYHYDPITGRYGLLISNSIRFAGIATVLVMVGFLWRSFRQERERTAKAAQEGLLRPLTPHAPGAS